MVRPSERKDTKSVSKLGETKRKDKYSWRKKKGLQLLENEVKKVESEVLELKRKMSW